MSEDMSIMEVFKKVEQGVHSFNMRHMTLRPLSIKQVRLLDSPAHDCEDVYVAISPIGYALDDDSVGMLLCNRSGEDLSNQVYRELVRSLPE